MIRGGGERKVGGEPTYRKKLEWKHRIGRNKHAEGPNARTRAKGGGLHFQVKGKKVETSGVATNSPKKNERERGGASFKGDNKAKRTRLTRKREKVMGKKYGR